MKTFGLIIPKGTGRVFDSNVRELLDENGGLHGSYCLCLRRGVTSAGARLILAASCS